MLFKFRQLLIGTPLPTQELAEKKLNKIRALAAFSPDALSSIAYANQEIYLGLVIAGSAGLALAWPIGLAITALLIIVAISYRQTIYAYPSGGGSYVVARDNLGTLPGLIAAAALLIDYILTAAVSLTAGLEAIASAFPGLYPHRVLLALGLLLLITLANLRGLRETGTLMSIPVYLFLVSYLPMLLIGAIKLFLEEPASLAQVAPPATQGITTFLILHAFATGCTALTGIEAISNGVPAFRPPEAKNASQTLVVMALLMAILFVGSIGLTQYLGVIAGPQETILSALARKVYGSGLPYLVVQTTTLLILAVAANTSFAGFPRVVSIIASDGFLPRQLANLGDRLVFTNGVVLLSLGAGLLIVLFQGNTHALIPLFAVGVFLAFSLSQAGMVVHWWRNREKGWPTKLIINGVGALATTLTLLIVGYSKFLEGAWFIIALVPLLVTMFFRIKAHYNQLRKQLSLAGLPPSLKPYPPMRVVLPISGVHRGIVEAVRFAESFARHITAVYVELEPGQGEHVRQEWESWWPDIPLVVIPSPYRSIVGPLFEFLDKYDSECNDGQQAAVVLPEFIPASWWHGLLHNQTSWLLKTALLYRRRHFGFQGVIIDVPYHLKR
ncbi:MAG: APC family permease [Anaerolineales bacterium]|nr:APC family permease [Anaerolineales bacterium]